MKKRGSHMVLKIKDIELYYEQYGMGRPLILLHGNGEHHTIFQEAIAILAHHFTIYALDSRGHGNSSKVKTLHYEDMADDVYQFIDTLQLEKPILYGFSDGGIIALSDKFYMLWLDITNIEELRLMYYVGIVSIMDCLISSVMYPIFNIFTVYNKLKYTLSNVRKHHYTCGYFGRQERYDCIYSPSWN